MFSVDPDAAHTPEFHEYANIIHVHRLAENSKLEELFVGQQFKNKTDCVFAIKRYNMKISVDYRVTNWLARTTFIQRTQQWTIKKVEGPYTCTSGRMMQDHHNLDKKIICNYIMPLVKDMPTIPVSVLTVDMQARF
ncbi:hypothetical protein PVK06_041091 [Gossypium arboreum]|uniref:Uncharacterized protein n=1 Tax=Gossypium arboreum TaxID=29729 RepID=A0ABR0N7E4_GOSAR|nr:hypothetical protein PVK06_041091 [Gossypium arboreum]